MDPPGLAAVDWCEAGTLRLVGASALAAFAINWSSTLVLGVTSALVMVLGGTTCLRLLV